MAKNNKKVAAKAENAEPEIKAENVLMPEPSAAAPETAVTLKKPKMKPIVKNTLVSTGVLILIAVVAVLLLSLANAFFPKYVPKLDWDTVKILNDLAPTGETDIQKMLDEEYFKMATPNEETLSKFNKADNEVIAVYKGLKGDSAGTVFVETSTIASSYSKGLRTVLITAVSPEQTFIKLYIRTEGDQARADAAQINEELKGKTVVSAGDFGDGILYNGSSASYTPVGFAKAINLAFDMAREIMAGEAVNG